MAYKIKFTTGGYWHGGLWTVEIFIDDNNCCKIIQGQAKSRNISDRQLIELPVDEEDCYYFRFDHEETYSVKIPDTMIFELTYLDIFSWKSHYENPNILDGEQWALAFTDGSRTYRGIGHNDYPENWREFRAWFNKILKKAGNRWINI